MPIEWNDDLRTGIPVIDQQHQELLVMLNRLGRFRCGTEDLLETFTELENYVNNHFQSEEDYMIEIKYPDFSEHKACHDKFVEDINAIKKKMDKDKNICDVGDELFDFVGGWIMHHYSDEDIKLVDYIKKCY